jgi:hypothetical protein
MKEVTVILALLLGFAVVLGVLVVQRTKPRSDCSGQVVITRDPSGEPVECICIGGTLSTCFNPGP